MLTGYKERIAVFLILVVVFSFFNIIAIAPKEVSAEVPYYCIQGKVNPDTGTRDYCFSGTSAELEGKCDGSISLGDVNSVSECQRVTCKPTEGQVCLSNVPKIKCEAEGGIPFNSPKESVPECQLGCCDTGGGCTVVENNECLGNFNAGQTNQILCSQSCSPSQLGCCEMVGDCSYTTLGQCDIGNSNVLDFYGGELCSGVTSCAARVDSHAYQACGDNNLQGETRHKIYFYDSAGNREELVKDCEYPDETCDDPDGKGGEIDAECRTTACVLEGDCPDCDIQEFLNGDSICLILHEGHFYNDGRSKGLIERVLTCNAGVVESTHDLDRDNEVCIEGSQTFGELTRRTSKVIDNNWGQCSSCGSGFDLDAFAFLPYLGAGIVALGSSCQEPIDWDFAGNWKLGEDCKDRGKVGDVEMCEYDHDLYAPIGSCNPIYPPAISTEDQCNKCGGGGDSFTNACTIEECNALGDCQFEHNNLDWNGLYNAGLLAVGTATAIVSIGWAVCSWIPGLCAAPPYWGTIMNILVTGGWWSAAYWVGFSLVVGQGATLANPDPRYDFAFRNEDDSINLAWGLALSNSIAKEIEEIGWVDPGMSSRGTSEGRALLLAVLSGISNPETFSSIVGALAAPIGRKMLSWGLERTIRNYLRDAAFAATDPASVIEAGIVNALKGQSGLSSGPFAIGEGAMEYAAEHAAQAYVGGVGIETASEVGALAGSEAAATETVKQAGSKLLTALQIIGALVSVYTVAQSLNTGNCRPEEAYINNDRCAQCGGGEGQWACTPIRCDILGGGDSVNNPIHCKFLPGDSPDEGVCEPLDVDDTALPNIVKVEATLFDSNDDYVRQEGPVDSNKLEITENFDWPELGKITLSIETNERANCKYSKNSETEYESMNAFDVGNYPLSNHVNITYTEEDKSEEDVRVYIKCEDLNGNKHAKTDDYNYLEVHFNERPDEFPPEVRIVSPGNNVRLPESTTQIEWIINVKENNGIAGCRYTQSGVSTYEEMESSFTLIGDVSCIGTDYTCTEYGTTLNLVDLEYLDMEELTGVEGAGRSYVFNMSCMDGAGNFNNPPLQMGFVVIPTFALTILSPIDGSESYESNPLIEVQTDSLTLCDYKMDGQEYNFSVDEPGFYYDYSIVHPDALSGSPSGTRHTLEVTCTDDAFNTVSESVEFYVIQDVNAPKLVSIYDKNSKLFVVLDEEATCTYHTSNVEETPMVPSVNTFKHQLSLDPDTLIYHISCLDVWNNELAFIVYV
mgnify:CR=1 FL=1